MTPLAQVLLVVQSLLLVVFRWTILPMLAPFDTTFNPSFRPTEPVDDLGFCPLLRHLRNVLSFALVLALSRPSCLC